MPVSAHRLCARMPVTLLATLGIMLGCGTPDDLSDEPALGELRLAARRCPDGECEPPPLPDDEPPPPPPPRPPQPDPAKARFIVVPTTFMSDEINFALADTFVQLTHTDGETLALPGIVHQCTRSPSDDEEREACLEFCSELAPKERGPCRAQCDTQSTCTYSCSNSATSTQNFVRWSAALKYASDQEACNATTCPACATPTQVATLKDDPLPVPIFHKTVLGLPGWPLYTISCRMNRWQFPFQSINIEVKSSPDGISFRVPGSTASPSVICDNLPNVQVDDLHLQLTLRFPWLGPARLVAEGALHGDIRTGAGPVVDYLGDVENHIKDKFAEIAGNRLNKPHYIATYKRLLLAIIGRYINSAGLDPMETFGYITTDYDGLHVQYWTN